MIFEVFYNAREDGTETEKASLITIHDDIVADCDAGDDDIVDWINEEIQQQTGDFPGDVYFDQATVWIDDGLVYIREPNVVDGKETFLDRLADDDEIEWLQLQINSSAPTD